METVPLDADGTGTNNTLASVFPTPAIGDQVLTFNGASGQYVTYKYAKKTSGVPPVTTTNWFNPGGTVAATTPNVINPGQGYFYLPAVNETNTYVGVVVVGNGSVTNNNLPAVGQYGFVSSIVPISGGITTTLSYQPNIGDNVLVYQNGGFVTYKYAKKTSGVPPVTVTTWYGPSGTAAEPQISVGQGFFLQPTLTTPNVWSESTTNL